MCWWCYGHCNDLTTKVSVLSAREVKLAEPHLRFDFLAAHVVAASSVCEIVGGTRTKVQLKV